MAEAMSWLSWSNPVAIWWGFLLAVSAANVVLLLVIRSCYRSSGRLSGAGAFAIEPLLLLAAAYVFGCAFRSILPRADVQRICLFDTALSSVLIGRSVATVAELCFVIQWAIVLRALGNLADSDTAKTVSRLIVPLIVLAEWCSWYAVITTDYLGNVLENSLWTATFLLIALALLRLARRFRGIAKAVIAGSAVGIAGYLVFMVTVDVPLYIDRWQAEIADGHTFFGLVAGFHDVADRWVVAHDFTRWRHEIPWMSLYFSVAVWASLALATFPLIAHLLPRYRMLPPKKAGAEAASLDPGWIVLKSGRN
jgi:hypothetical protein